MLQDPLAIDAGPSAGSLPADQLIQTVNIFGIVFDGALPQIFQARLAVVLLQIPVHNLELNIAGQPCQLISTGLFELTLVVEFLLDRGLQTVSNHLQSGQFGPAHAGEF